LNKIKSVEAADLIHNQKQKFIVDVRNFGETKDGKLCNAKTIPLGTFKDFLTKYADILPSDENIHVYCRSGARAQVATSILMKYGFKNAFTVKQGYSDLES
jgi:rhodanese-related sulfurtransferase